ncbi:uncharacterized protein ASPGLDRAFT_50944 [Aspergillus glaucus CBS 516.65]|uniref:Uncharacterized protein n=1 Tax=Aspergillus glaucus CBS 516.65 TaxID=1160497 RepID=A0A1L9VAV2_ASPGL|nr:hypothetical protein ASPGLDRAFT_50944 [Aspergillus glaucus CBS 516.65]OJJ80962.1 hypothetical protein ASPGLDRAFT_50944 [Aspergillus glaucus CBS 516.65]
MKLSIFASLFLAGSAIAAGAGGSGGSKTIDDNQPCQSDSKTEYCKSGLCVQEPSQTAGVCKPKGQN